MSKKFAFVNYGNSREGAAISAALKEEKFFVYATRKPDPQNLAVFEPDPLTVDQFITADVETVVETMKTCKVVVYTILDDPAMAVEVFTKLDADPGVKKSVGIVSPLFTWLGEPKAEDWKKRWPHERYAAHLSAERYLTSLNLKINVMCVGLLYGEGEGPLLPIFRDAWHLQGVPILKPGNNVIPALHVRDMALGVVYMCMNRQESPVVIAHDGTGVTQREMIKAINGYFGAKRARGVDEETMVAKYGRECTDWLMLDCELEATEFSEFDFERVCAGGIIEEIEQIGEEFVNARLLKPLRILMVGYDSNVIKQVAEYYGVPIANQKTLREYFDADNSEDALAIKESAGEEEDVSETEIMRHVLANSPLFRNAGFVLTGVPEDEEVLEELFIEADEETAYMPKYLAVRGDKTAAVKWFMSKGSNYCQCQTFADVQQFLGLPRNFTRNMKLLDNRRRLEIVASQVAEEERIARKNKARDEERRIEMLKERDDRILAEVEAELRAAKDVREMDPKEFLMSEVVPIVLPALVQLNESRPDEPLKFLSSYYEKEIN